MRPTKANLCNDMPQSVDGKSIRRSDARLQPATKAHDNHVKHFKDAPEGIKVLGADGKVLPAVREVLKVCTEQKLVVHTGHYFSRRARHSPSSRRVATWVSTAWSSPMLSSRSST
jgi:Family of unknown function (DUF6282)